MEKSLIVNESKSILKNSKLLIAIIAVIAIPILYAGMFLWAFWDPYDYLEDLPVAVVNADEGVIYEDEHLELGDELVANLKEEADLDFHFVDEEEGYQDLMDQKYYVLIKIPEDFSNNATTLLDDKPEKLDLIYAPNEGFNFLAGQMGETAMLLIESTLEENIIETYASMMFDNVDEIGEGLMEASDGTDKLNDGAHDLLDGSTKLKESLGLFAGNSIEFNEGVNTAYSGSITLAEGSDDLSSGMGELNDANGQLLDASKEIKEGSSDLANGVLQANDGLASMRDQSPELIEGTDQIKSGLEELENELPKQMAEQIGEQISGSSEAMNDGLDELQDGIVNGLQGKDGMVDQLTSGLSQGISGGVAEEVTGVLDGAPAQIAGQMTPVLMEQQQAQVDGLFTIMNQMGIDISSQEKEQIQQILASESPTEEQMQAGIEEQLAAGFPNVDDVESKIESEIQPQISAGIEDAVDQTVKGISGGFKQYKDTVNEGLSGATDGMEDDIKTAISPPLNQLQEGLTSLRDGQVALNEGVIELADGTEELKAGSDKLLTGQSLYVDNLEQFNGKFSEANQGAGDLTSGANDLTDGMGLLTDGSEQLADGSEQLADGSKELTDGTNELTEGTEELNDKLHDASDEVNSVESNDDTYNMMANPVEVKDEVLNDVPNYGTGFAPYFLSLGLFVGALLLSIVFPLQEPASAPRNGFNWFMSKFTILFGIGILQALIASGILLIGLGLEVQSIPLFILYSIITSLTFITLIQFFVTCFGDPGRFMAILILIMQLTTSAGTFPLELIPKSLQFFNTFLPMTYTVAGFKAVVSSGDYSVMWQNAGILMIFTVMFMLGSLTYFTLMFKRKYQHLATDETTV
ncbi:MAG TPA: YhgE/Pip domain-containing protein [Virgibacillus sp.]|nr:YhgE/Pip domain-containing protein [Virgibacillus sp.]